MTMVEIWHEMNTFVSFNKYLISTTATDEYYSGSIPLNGSFQVTLLTR